MQRSRFSQSFICSTVFSTAFAFATGACQLDDENSEAVGTETGGTLTTTAGTSTGQTGTGDPSGSSASETGSNTSTGPSSTTGVDPSTSGSTTGATTDTGTGSSTDSSGSSSESSSDSSSDSSTGTDPESSTTDSSSTTTDSSDSTESESSSDETGSDTTGPDSSGGKLGASCNNATDCESHLVCADLLPNIASTCSECGPKDMCKNPVENLCSPTWKPLINRNPYYICVGPKSLKSGSVCLPQGTGPNACKDFCVEVEEFKSLGVCGECRPGESDCPAGEECTEPSFGPLGFVGSKCKAL